MKIGKKIHSDLGSRVLQDLQDLGQFSGNFGLAKDRIELDVKGGYKRHKLQQKRVKKLPYFGQDTESKNKVAGIPAHVCLRASGRSRIAPRNWVAAVARWGWNQAECTSQNLASAKFTVLARLTLAKTVLVHPGGVHFPAPPPLSCIP